MDDFDQIPRRRPKATGISRFLPFIVIGYMLLTSFAGTIVLPSAELYLSDPIFKFFFNSSIFIGGVIVAMLLLISYMTYSK
ncbi:MAG: hypothetical protein GYA51_04295 [Candidatus Methanofastidiosa archaeon]|nr:hypothetical protein [Candidatus Methanofastidiosa archaeon]